MAFFWFGSDTIKLKRPSFLLSPNYKTVILVPTKIHFEQLKTRKFRQKAALIKSSPFSFSGEQLLESSSISFNEIIFRERQKN